MKERTGTVLFGVNNIFTINDGEVLFECRIKGKILRNAEGDYNPLAAGDRVVFSVDEKNPRKGVLLSRENRKNAIIRWNKKGRSPQTIAANLDLVVCVTSPLSPPFRPRFLDRLLIAAESSGIPGLVCLNKCDQSMGNDVEERLADYGRRNVPVIRTSALNGFGIDTLRAFITGKRAVFIGQSGVGKTSLLNLIVPGLDMRVGKISEKHNRGCHTTVLAHLEDWTSGEVIDTPGVREFEIHGISSRDLRFFFEEFKAFAPRCQYGGGCTHIHEPECAVREAAGSGAFPPDRYDSYRRIQYDLVRREKRPS